MHIDNVEKNKLKIIQRHQLFRDTRRLHYIVIPFERVCVCVCVYPALTQILEGLLKFPTAFFPTDKRPLSLFLAGCMV